MTSFQHMFLVKVIEEIKRCWTLLQPFTACCPWWLCSVPGFYKKHTGSCLIINSLKPVILWASEFDYFLFGGVGNLLLHLALQGCSERACFPSLNDDLHTSAPPPPLSGCLCTSDSGCGICSEWLASVALLCWLTHGRVLASELPPKSLLPSVCHSPPLPPPPPLSFHSALACPNTLFNSIFTDLEIAFHQLWMLKETNLLPSPSPSAAGPMEEEAVRLH